MRISKMMMNFAVLACVAGVAGTASAESTCNMRDGKGRFAASNPEKSEQKTSVAQKVQTRSTKGKK